MTPKAAQPAAAAPATPAVTPRRAVPWRLLGALVTVGVIAVAAVAGRGPSRWRFASAPLSASAPRLRPADRRSRGASRNRQGARVARKTRLEGLAHEARPPRRAVPVTASTLPSLSSSFPLLLVPPLVLLATLAPWRFLLPPLDAVAVTLICSPTLARIAMRPDAHARLSLRLVDGTRLWCLPSLLAGGNALVATFRERLAAVPRFETP